MCLFFHAAAGIWKAGFRFWRVLGRALASSRGCLRSFRFVGGLWIRLVVRTQLRFVFLAVKNVGVVIENRRHTLVVQVDAGVWIRKNIALGIVTYERPSPDLLSFSGAGFLARPWTNTTA
jgi:hypothetical protein